MVPLIWIIGLLLFVGVIWFVVSMFSPNSLIDIAAAIVAAIIWVAVIGTPISTAVASGLPGSTGAPPVVVAPNPGNPAPTPGNPAPAPSNPQPPAPAPAAPAPVAGPPDASSGGSDSYGQADLAHATDAQTSGRGSMSIAKLTDLYKANCTPGQPGKLITALDVAFDSTGGNIGGQNLGTNWKVPSGSVVWTNTNHVKPTLMSGKAADGGKWVPLCVQGSWGVFYAFDDLVLPSPGRYARTERQLNPSVDLPGWQ